MSSSRQMVVLRAFKQTQTVAAHKGDVMVLAAKTIYETVSKSTEAIVDFDTAVTAIAELLPGGTTFADRLAQEYDTIIRECAGFFQDSLPTTTRQGPTENSTQIIVETSAERDLRDKYVAVGGYRLWKKAEAPWDVFYCHLWVNRTPQEWLSTWAAFCGSTIMPETLAHRQRCCDALIVSWFDLTKDVTRYEDLTPIQVRLFQTTVELVAEGYLVRRGVPLAGSVGTATAALAQALAKRKHDQRPMDYFTDLQEARQAKDGPSQRNSSSR
jgi:hypothetical protein